MAVVVVEAAVATAGVIALAAVNGVARVGLGVEISMAEEVFVWQQELLVAVDIVALAVDVVDDTFLAVPRKQFSVACVIFP